MSAAAVEAVRLGLRTALAPARSPATPPARRAGQPTTRASGLTRRGAEQRDAHEQPEHAAAEQQRHRSAAHAAGEHAGRDRGERGEDARRARSWPSAPRSRDGGSDRALADRRDRRHAGGPPRGQDAGEHRDRRCRASSETDDRARRDRPCRPWAGRRPARRSGRSCPWRSRCPATSPSSEASRPMTRPSSTTERLTCLREAPSVRSVANSRVRCATVIDSVLKITNAPTSSAMPPKPSRTRRIVFMPVVDVRGVVLGLLARRP